MIKDREEGESLVCSLCKQIILFFPNKHTEDYVKLQYLKHIRTCGGIPPNNNTNEDINF